MFRRDLRFIIAEFLFAFLFLPQIIFASECSNSGYTVLAINGVFTNESGAKKNSDALKYYFKDTYNGESLKFDFLPNPSHLGGLGDLVISAYQKIFDSETVQDYDLIEIWKTASEKVTTQKLLFVAHSQGNFYANSLYDSLSNKEGGVPKQSLGIYSVATPASRVAGNGLWLTSDTDEVIAGIVGRLPLKKIMKPNAHIQFEKSDDPLGHDFTKVYLKYEADKIISDVQASLDRLMTNGTQISESPCISPPKLTVAHKIEGKILAVLDPPANKMAVAVKTTASGVHEVSLAFGKTADQLVSIFGSLATSAIKSLITKTKGVNQVGTVALATEDGQQEENNSQVLAVGQNQSVNKNIGQVEGDEQEPPLAAPVREITPDMGASETINPVVLSDVSLSAVTPNVTAPSQTPTLNPPVSPVVFSISPGFGGGLPAVVSTQEEGPPPDEPPAAAPAPEPEPPAPPAPPTCADNTATNFGSAPPCLYPPSAPAVTSPADFSFPFSTTTLTFVGTSLASTTISNSLNSSTTTADVSGNWTLYLSGFSQGTTTVNFYATDQNNSTSSPTSVSFSVDTVAPIATTLSVAECSNTLTADSCTTYATSLHFTWTSITGIDHYGIFKNGALIATTSVNSYTAAVSPDPTPFSFEITTYDAVLNTATSSAQSVSVINLPSIGSYCSPYSTSFIEGGTYNPTITTPATFLDCTFLSSSLSGNRYGVIYRGNVGSSTMLMSSNLTGRAIHSQLLSVNRSSFVNGENYFITIYEVHDNTGANGAAFDRYFSTNANPPPHLNYGVINWIYDNTAP